MVLIVAHGGVLEPDFLSKIFLLQCVIMWKIVVRTFGIWRQKMYALYDDHQFDFFDFCAYIERHALVLFPENFLVHCFLVISKKIRNFGLLCVQIMRSM